MPTKTRNRDEESRADAGHRVAAVPPADEPAAQDESGRTAGPQDETGVTSSPGTSGARADVPAGGRANDDAAENEAPKK